MEDGPTRDANAGGVVDSPHAADAGTGLPDRVRSGVLDDSRMNRNVGATIPNAPRTTRSSRGVRTTAANNPQILTLGAGPRTVRVLAAVPKCSSLTWAVRTAWAGESAADSVATVPDGDAGPPRSHARSGSPDGVANAGRLGGKSHYSNDSGVGWAETTARSL